MILCKHYNGYDLPYLRVLGHPPHVRANYSHSLSANAVHYTSMTEAQLPSPQQILLGNLHPVSHISNMRKNCGGALLWYSKYQYVLELYTWVP